MKEYAVAMKSAMKAHSAQAKADALKIESA